MKKVLIMLFLGVCLNVHSQETARQKELGIVFSSLNNFGIAFKIGNEKALWRFQGLQISGNDFDSESIREDNNNFKGESSSSSIGFSVFVGREYRTQINDKFEIRYGFDVSFGYNEFNENFESMNDLNTPPLFSKTEIVSTTYRYGVNAVLGFNYIHNSLVFGAEILPGVSFQESETDRTESRNSTGVSETIESTDNSNSVNYGLNNGFALLSITYRF